MVGIGFLPGQNYSIANAVSADGATVVGRSSQFTQPNLFGIPSALCLGQRTRHAGPQSGSVGFGVLPADWDREEATGVSADGETIVGWGTNASNQQEAWIATIPEPRTGLLVMAGVFGLAGTRRTRA
jgi:hypothetical protein